jgi:hypothetical protein
LRFYGNAATSEARIQAAGLVVDFWGRKMSRKRKLNDDAEILRSVRLEQVGVQMIKGSPADDFAVETFSKK